MEEGTVQYANKYAILCENPHEMHGTLNTLEGIMKGADVVVLDTSLIPTVRKDIQRVTPKQARNVCFLYDKLTEIFSSEKVRVHPAISDEIRNHLRHEYEAARTLGQTVPEYVKFQQAADKLSKIIPGSTAVPKEFNEIYRELFNALDFVDNALQIRHQKRFQKEKDTGPTPVDLENLAYTLTFAIASPEKTHVLLGRDVDYLRLFDSTIALAYSSNFSVGNKNGDTVQKKIGNPQLKITYCKEQLRNQPFLIERIANKIMPGADYIWDDNVKEQTREEIVQEMRIRFGRVFVGLQQMRQQKETQVAILPAAAASSIDLCTIYEAMRVTGDDVARKDEQGRLRTVLEGYRQIYSLAKQNNAQKILDEMKKDLQGIEQYLLKSQKKEAITVENVSRKDRAGELEQMIKQQERLRETAQFLGMDALSRAASQSLGIAKGYIKKIQPAIKSNVNELEREIQSSQKKIEEGKEKIEVETREIESNSQKLKGWKERETYYARLRETLKGVAEVDINIIVAGQPDTGRSTEEKKEFGEVIYKNLCQVIGHEPQEGEEIGKRFLVQAIGIARTRFSDVVKRAGVDETQIPLGKGNSSFAFSRKALGQIGNVLRSKPKELGQ